MSDMTEATKPKTDQVNADDLLGGPRTIKITKIVIKKDAAQQKISVFFDGDDGKPFKPCTTMGRVMMEVWDSNDSKTYVGKSMTLFRDPEAIYGGVKVGGVRISHMSHINTPKTVMITVSRGVKKPFTVKPLITGAAPKEAHPDVIKQGDEAANTGVAGYKGWFEKLAPEVRATIKNHHVAWKSTAEQVDKEKIAVTVKTDDEGYPIDTGEGDPE